MPMKRSLLFALPLVVATALSMESAAHAQGDPGRADALYREAVELFKGGNVKGACAKLDESFGLDPKTQTLFSLAKCRQREGRVATAWLQFTELVKRGEREGDAAKLAEYKTKVAELDRLVPRATLRLESHPEVTEVRLDGKPVPRSQWAAPVPIDPGEHVFQFSGTGKADAEKRINVREGEAISVEFDPLRDAAAGGGPPGEGGAGGSVSTKDGSSPTLGYILGGVGIAAIGVGTITGIVAINDKSTADDRFERRDPAFKDSDDAASTMALVSTISWVVGIIGVGAGAYLILTHDSKKSASTNRIQLGASTDRIVIGGRF
jgi:hypothetical protein